MNSKILGSTVCAAMLSLCASATFAQAASAPAPAAAPAAAATSTTSASAGAITADGSGKLAWYGRKFAGRKTASGERFAPEALTMAHKSLPFGTRVKVINPKNNKSVVVRVNDRGPTQGDRIGDVSLAAARQLGMLKAGVIDAELTVIGAAPATKR